MPFGNVSHARTAEERSAADRAFLLAGLAALVGLRTRRSGLREATERYLIAHPYDMEVLRALVRYLDLRAPPTKETA